MSAFAVAHPQISCIASLLWRSSATLDLLLLFVAISATIFAYALGWCVLVCFFLKIGGVFIMVRPESHRALCTE
ncbi:hypothetical protein CU664_12185 [Pseudomonas syringae pv. actinidifoliorum]|uniref:hypothetical protein n=1 Tax=Pseudomonas syringae TaxID=317 RepID=UPI001DE45683|nr:hypothetical protein [Pseudomonas syringae pv. actinidifoliorum]NAT63984.1 hypothetical protein [Pseudomonas syringae pv. actinidifoliorum]